MENSCIYNIANILETFILLKCLATQFQPKTSDKKYRQYCSLQNILFLKIFLFFHTRYTTDCCLTVTCSLQ